MLADILEAPERRPHHLAAELLRQRDAHGLGLAVGMVRAEPDPHPVVEHHDHRLDLTRRVRPEHFEPSGLHHVVDGVAIEHRYRRRPRHADLGQFLDVMA